MLLLPISKCMAYIDTNPNVRCKHVLIDPCKVLYLVSNAHLQGGRGRYHLSGQQRKNTTQVSGQQRKTLLKLLGKTSEE